MRSASERKLVSDLNSPRRYVGAHLMEKIRLTKNELKRQKDALRRFERYLPALTLKKQQLQAELVKIQHQIEESQGKIFGFKESLKSWVAVFAEEAHIEDLIRIDKIEISNGNIAGIDIPVFEKVNFKEEEYDLITTPLWVDYGIKAVKNLLTLKIQLQIFQRQLALVKEELRITTQRVNLFEKIMIPQAKENIRKISVFLGDLQTTAVVIGKVAKRKIESKQEALVEL